MTLEISPAIPPTEPDTGSIESEMSRIRQHNHRVIAEGIQEQAAAFINAVDLSTAQPISLEKLIQIQDENAQYRNCRLVLSFKEDTSLDSTLLYRVSIDIYQVFLPSDQHPKDEPTRIAYREWEMYSDDNEDTQLNVDGFSFTSHSSRGTGLALALLQEGEGVAERVAGKIASFHGKEIIRVKIKDESAYGWTTRVVEKHFPDFIQDPETAEEFIKEISV